jgi:hypothetical protein
VKKEANGQSKKEITQGRRVKTKEARELWIRAMDHMDVEEPDANYRYCV